MKKITENEALMAFIALLVVILVLVVIASNFDAAKATDVVSQAKIRIIDSAIAGLIAILGMAAQALFKINQVDRDLAATAKAAAEKVPPVTGEAKESKDEMA